MTDDERALIKIAHDETKRLAAIYEEARRHCERIGKRPDESEWFCGVEAMAIEAQDVYHALLIEASDGVLAPMVAEGAAILDLAIKLARIDLCISATKDKREKNKLFAEGRELHARIMSHALEYKAQFERANASGFGVSL